MDSREYRAAVEQHGDMVYRIALNQTQCAPDAEDVTQSVFMKLFIRGPRKASPEHVKRWLIRVTVNECKSMWRTAWRKRVELRGVQSEEIVTSAHSTEVERIASEDDGYGHLREAISKLPEKSRLIIFLFYYEGYATRDIASILRMREATVRTSLSRARRQLKEMLKGVQEDER